MRGVVDSARVMAETLMGRGFTLVSGGTDNHLMLVDLGERCSGKDAEEALGRARITVNKNTVPGEKRSPMVTSGIRIGTPAMTTRGIRGDDVVQVANWIADVIEHRDDEAVVARVAGQVHELCGRHPVYPADLLDR
jgi:glycine hydroxymethyltransferase